jgi:hypothetical protein
MDRESHHSDYHKFLLRSQMLLTPISAKPGRNQVWEADLISSSRGPETKRHVLERALCMRSDLEELGDQTGCCDHSESWMRPGWDN